MSKDVIQLNLNSDKFANVVYGILNFQRQIDLKDIFKEKIKDLIICTNNEVNILRDEIEYDNLHTINYNGSIIGSAKNLIIKKALELKADYLFIIEDDVIVKDHSVYQKYIDKMNQYDNALIYYGFHGVFNKVMNKPNPSLLIRLSKDETECFNRFTCPAFICLNLKKIVPPIEGGQPILFDEHLLTNEFLEYIVRLKNEGLLTFPHGFYNDVFESWRYIERKDVPRVRNATQADLQKDQEYLKSINFEFKPESSIDILINKLREIRGE